MKSTFARVLFKIYYKFPSWHIRKNANAHLNQLKAMYVDFNNNYESVGTYQFN